MYKPDDSRPFQTNSRVIYSCFILVLGLLMGYLGIAVLNSLDSIKESFSSSDQTSVGIQSGGRGTGFWGLHHSGPSPAVSLLEQPGAKPIGLIAAAFKSAPSAQSSTKQLTGNDQRTADEIREALATITPIWQELAKRDRLVDQTKSALQEARSALDQITAAAKIYQFISWDSIASVVDSELKTLSSPDLHRFHELFCRLNTLKDLLSDAQKHPSALTSKEQQTLLYLFLHDPLVLAMGWLNTSKAAFDTTISGAFKVLSQANQECRGVTGYPQKANATLTNLQKQAQQLSAFQQPTKPQLILAIEQYDNQLKALQVSYKKLQKQAASAKIQDQQQFAKTKAKLQRKIRQLQDQLRSYKKQRDEARLKLQRTKLKSQQKRGTQAQHDERILARYEAKVHALQVREEQDRLNSQAAIAALKKKTGERITAMRQQVTDAQGQARADINRAHKELLDQILKDRVLKDHRAYDRLRKERRTNPEMAYDQREIRERMAEMIGDSDKAAATQLFQWAPSAAGDETSFAAAALSGSAPGSMNNQFSGMIGTFAPSGSRSVGIDRVSV